MKWLRTKMNRNVIPLLRKELESLTSYLYPHRCPICGCLVDKEGEICQDCGYGLRYILDPYCLKCGKAMETEKEYCRDCETNSHIYDRGVGAFAYNEEMKKAIYRFKYENKREYAKSFAKAIANLRADAIKGFRPDVLMPVPLYANKEKIRGYNQSALVAKELGKLLNIPVDYDALIKTRDTLPQKELNDKERIKNVKNAFQVTKNIVQYKHIVLIDDIYTTGATLDACSKVLKDCGCERVYHVCICIGRGF